MRSLAKHLGIAAFLFSGCGDSGNPQAQPDSSDPADVATDPVEDRVEDDASNVSDAPGDGTRPDTGDAVVPDADPPDAPPADTSDPDVGPDGIVASGRFGADGGMLVLGDGLELVVPAGAIAEEVTITVSRRVDVVDDAGGAIHTLRLEPAGTLFATPALLRVPVESSGAPIVEAWLASDLNGVVDLGAETTNLMTMTERLPVEPGYVTLEVPHFTFSTVLIRVQRYLYLVVDVPPRYLLPGDLLFTMTKFDSFAPNWQPGHVSVFTGQTPPCAESEVDELIEANGDVVAVDHLNRRVVEREDDDGPYTEVIPGVRTRYDHLYMGARRPRAGLSDAQRADMVTFLRAQVGKPYSTVLGGGNLDEDEWSCVGLAEAALDHVGAGALNGVLFEALVMTPIELFSMTRPVDEITVYAGEEVVIPVTGVVVHPDSPAWGVTLRGGYCARYPCCTAAGDDCNGVVVESVGGPADGRLVPTGTGTWEYRWTPGEDDVGADVVVEFVATATPTLAGATGRYAVGEVVARQQLTLEVDECPGGPRLPGISPDAPMPVERGDRVDSTLPATRDHFFVVRNYEPATIGLLLEGDPNVNVSFHDTAGGGLGSPGVNFCNVSDTVSSCGLEIPGAATWLAEDATVTLIVSGPPEASYTLELVPLARLEGPGAWPFFGTLGLASVHPVTGVDEATGVLELGAERTRAFHFNVDTAPGGFARPATYFEPAPGWVCRVQGHEFSTYLSGSTGSLQIDAPGVGPLSFDTFGDRAGPWVQTTLPPPYGAGSDLSAAVRFDAPSEIGIEVVPFDGSGSESTSWLTAALTAPGITYVGDELRVPVDGYDAFLLAFQGQGSVRSDVSCLGNAALLAAESGEATLLSAALGRQFAARGLTVATLTVGACERTGYPADTVGGLLFSPTGEPREWAALACHLFSIPASLIR